MWFKIKLRIGLSLVQKFLFYSAKQEVTVTQEKVHMHALTWTANLICGHSCAR